MKKFKLTFFPEDDGSTKFKVVEVEKFEINGDMLVFRDKNDNLTSMYNIKNIRDVKPFIEKEDQNQN